MTTVDRTFELLKINIGVASCMESPLRFLKGTKYSLHCLGWKEGSNISNFITLVERSEDHFTSDGTKKSPQQKKNTIDCGGRQTSVET